MFQLRYVRSQDQIQDFQQSYKLIPCHYYYHILLQLSSTVKVYDSNNDTELTYKIVGNLESDPENGHISIETPIAKGLIGKFVDDEIKIQTPSGDLNYEVIEVKHI